MDRFVACGKNPCLRELAMSVDKSAEGGRSIMTVLSYTSH